MDKLGRDRDHLKILPGAFVVVGDTAGEAREKRALLDSLVHYDSAIASLSIALGHDASGFDPDGPLPRDSRKQCEQERTRAGGRAGKRENLTVRQLAQRVGGYGGLAFVGTPTMIADQMEEWLVTEGPATASTSCSPICPAGSTTSSTAWCRNCNGAGFSARIRRQDAEGKSRLAAARKPLLPNSQAIVLPSRFKWQDCADKPSIEYPISP